MRRGIQLGAIAIVAMAGSAQGQFVGFGQSICSADLLGTNEDYSDVLSDDLDGDGISDIVFITDFGRVRYISGSFGAALGSPTQIMPNSGIGLAIDLGDFNGDGFVDVIRLAEDTAAVDVGEISLYLNDGFGQFSVRQDLSGFGPVGNQGRTGDIFFSDINGDSNPDVVTLHDNGIAYAISDGNVFGLPTVQEITGFPVGFGMSVGDMDGDGLDDVVAINDSSFRVLVSNGSSYSIVDSESFPVGSDVRDVVLIDVNDDGNPDACFADFDRDRLYTYINDGQGRLTFFQDTLGFNGPYDLEAVNIDGDMDTDLVVITDPDGGSSGDGYSIAFNNGFSIFGDIEFFASSPSQAFTLAAINPDSGPDLIRAFQTNDAVCVNINQTPATPPSTPLLVAPVNGAPQLPTPQAVASWGGRVVPLAEWERSTGFGVDYSIVIASNPSLSNIVAQISSIEDRVVDLSGVSLQPGTTYYWDVIASNSAGSTESANGPFSFTTQSLGNDCVADANLDGIVSPADFGAWVAAYNAGCP